METTFYAKINFINPRTVKRIVADPGDGTCAGDSQGGVVRNSLMALSLMVSFPLEPQLERFGPVQELAKSPVYGRPELNCMTVLMVQFESRCR
jgi:hypothetical protein